MIYVVPREGLKVPDPEQLTMPDHHLPAEGRLVGKSDYWTRRLMDQDVFLGTAPNEPTEEPPPAE